MRPMKQRALLSALASVGIGFAIVASAEGKNCSIAKEGFPASMLGGGQVDQATLDQKPAKLQAASIAAECAQIAGMTGGGQHDVAKAVAMHETPRSLGADQLAANSGQSPTAAYFGAAGG